MKHSERNHSRTFYKIMLAVYFVLGGAFTFYLTVERIAEDRNLQALCSILAIIFDVLFFRTFYLLAKDKVLPNVLKVLGSTFSFLFSKISILAEKISDAFSHEQKNFMEGKKERRFVFETHEKTKVERRKLPKLSKDADEREKIRHAYIVYVFGKNKNIPSSLTPNEVRQALDHTGEDREIFNRYNEVRYTE